MEHRRFSIVTPGTNEVVHGLESVPFENVYVSLYGKRLPGQKPVRNLTVGEGSLHDYNLSGAAMTYSIVRVA